MINSISHEIWRKSFFGHNAGFGVRVLAFLIDVVIFLPIIFLLSVLTYSVKYQVPLESFLVLFLLYQVVLQWKKGATFGKTNRITS